MSHVPWLGRMQGTGEKHAAMVFVCESVCVSLQICNTVVSLQMKIRDFLFKVEKSAFPWMPEVLHHGNMSTTFILRISLE